MTEVFDVPYETYLRWWYRRHPNKKRTESPENKEAEQK